MSRKYHPNNWKKIKDADDEWFVPIEFEELITWKVHGWEIPESVHCILRAEHVPTKKITEHTYQLEHAFQKRLRQYLSDADYEVTIATQDAIHLIGRATDAVDTE